MNDNEDVADMDAREPRLRGRWTDERPPSVAVVELVAEATGQSHSTLPPLYEFADPDALNALVRAGTDDTDQRLSVSFPYDGISVTVHTSGAIELDGVGPASD